MTIQITSVNNNTDIFIVANLANEIWHQHFTSIIGIEQVSYMLEKFQSVQAITDQIESGWLYFLAKLGDEYVGYTGLVPKRTKNG